MRLPRKSSINRREDFARVKLTGLAKAGRFVVVSTLAEPDLAGLRTGFITTKRCGPAHVRVLLRRRLRALVQETAPDFDELKRYLVIIARPAAAAATFSELRDDFIKQVRRLKLSGGAS